jgi:DNA-binding MarR family transcriptional regulator
VKDVSSPPEPSALEAERAKAAAVELAAAMGAVRRVARRAVRAAAHADPLPPARSELLHLAARRPGIGVAEAAAELHLAPNSVSTMVSKLAEDGLLNRGRGETDGRSVRLTVTEAGAARVEQWRDIRADLTGRAFGRLTPADQQAIMAAIPALTRLAAQMDQLLSPRRSRRQPGAPVHRTDQRTELRGGCVARPPHRHRHQQVPSRGGPGHPLTNQPKQADAGRGAARGAAQPGAPLLALRDFAYWPVRHRPHTGRDHGRLVCEVEDRGRPVSEEWSPGKQRETLPSEPYLHT